MSFYVLLLMVVGSVLVAAFARSREWNTALIVLAVALAISWVPGVGQIEVSSEILLGVVLPPLLYSAALQSSYQDFRASIKPILNLGVGAVLVTAFAVGALVYFLIPGVPFAAAMVLGAVVAPPDAVAATAVAKRLGLPRRITTVLGGESLINDATSLTLYKVALAGVVAVGSQASNPFGVFFIAVVAGVGVGVVLGWIVHLIRSRLDDSIVATVIGILTPFLGYWLAEEIHGSGVLAVVSAGFLIGRLAPRESFSTRLYEEPLWHSIDLVLECFTFALIGLQLQWVIKDIINAPDHTWRGVWVSLAVLAVVIIVRPIYVFATRFVGGIRMPWERSTKKHPPDTKDLTIVSWAGMRGVVTLAAAAAIPLTINGGEPFPQRATLQLAAYTVAIGTLLLQGLTLPSVIRKLGVDNTQEAADDIEQEKMMRRVLARTAAAIFTEERSQWRDRMGKDLGDSAIEQVRTIMARREAAAAVLAQTGSENTDRDDVDSFEQRKQALADDLTSRDKDTSPPGDQTGDDKPQTSSEPHHMEMMKKERHGWFRKMDQSHFVDVQKSMNELRLKIVREQRNALVSERDAGHLDETVMRIMLRELDLEEESLSTSWTTRLDR